MANQSNTYHLTSIPSPLIATRPRLLGLLTAISEELEDVPLYYSLPDMCSTLSLPQPKKHDIWAALLNAGYRVSSFHKDAKAIKTDAPSYVLWDIMRQWEKDCKIEKRDPAKWTEACKKIMNKPMTIHVNFTYPPELLQRLAEPKMMMISEVGEEIDQV